jgi:FtsH-binding integral membrane protein
LIFAAKGFIIRNTPKRLYFESRPARQTSGDAMQDFTNYNPNPRNAGLSHAAVSSEALFFQRIYAWMCAGLALTAGTAYLLSTSAGWIRFLIQNQWALWVAVIVQLGLVFYLSARINNLALGAARGLFLAYAALTGATFSVLLLVYPSYAFIKAFVCTAGIYGAMALYGAVTKRSLQAWGSFLFMGIIGIVLASVVNMFVKSAPLDLTICVIGVLIFAGLTAYDHQKLRVQYYALERNAGGGQGAIEMEGRVVIMGALTLYLDFINLFLMLLRLFGRRD